MNSDTEYKELSIREFTKAAEVYDGVRAGIYEMCRDDYPPILEELRKDDFDDLLDVGCGTGPMIELLASELPGRSYTGLDLTPRMIEVACAKGIENACFVVGDAEDLPFDGHSRRYVAERLSVSESAVRAPREGLWEDGLRSKNGLEHILPMR